MYSEYLRTDFISYSLRITFFLRRTFIILEKDKSKCLKKHVSDVGTEPHMFHGGTLYNIIFYPSWVDFNDTDSDIFTHVEKHNFMDFQR